MAGLQPHERHFLRFLAGHLAVGVAAATGLMGLILAFDLFALRSLIFGQSGGWLAGGLLYFGLAVTFGSVAMGIGVMGQAKDGEDDGPR
jgi:hypothetical protein